MVHTVATFNSIKVRNHGSFPCLPRSPSLSPSPVFSKALVLISCMNCSTCHSPGPEGVLARTLFTLFVQQEAVLSLPGPGDEPGELLPSPPGGPGAARSVVLEGSDCLSCLLSGPRAGLSPQYKVLQLRCAPWAAAAARRCSRAGCWGAVDLGICPLGCC